jgi:hypothetical protein
MRFMRPAVSGMTIERNARVSSRMLSSTTTAIVSTRPPEISSARSTYPAVVPPTSAVMSASFVARGMVSSRSVRTSVSVARSAGPVVGVTVMTAAFDESLSSGGVTEATPFVLFRSSLRCVRRGSVAGPAGWPSGDGGAAGSGSAGFFVMSTAMSSGAFAPTPNPAAIAS